VWLAHDTQEINFLRGNWSKGILCIIYTRMSIVPSGTESANLNELPNLLKRWMGIQEEMSMLNSELKQRRTQSKALKDMILRIM
jgi:hypothetical protein